jgi:hypothetical protein
LGLAPPDAVQVIPTILSAKTKSKPPAIRCLSLGSRPSLDVGNVDSVDKVYRILNKHMQVKVCEYIDHTRPLSNGGITNGHALFIGSKFENMRMFEMEV